jgi:hypothetical protein
MFRFLNNLLRNFHTNNTASRKRKPARRPQTRRLGLEALEDRAVPSAMALASSSIVQTQVAPLVSRTFNFQPGLTIIRSDGAGDTVVSPAGQASFQYPTASTGSVSILMHSTNAACVVEVDDSNGMPFAQFTSISVSDSGNNGFLNLTGSRTVAGNETFAAGGMSGAFGTILLDNLVFSLKNTSTGVFDSLPITGTLDVPTFGAHPQLVSYGPGGQNYFSGLAASGGAGNYFAFSNIPTVVVDAYAANAGVFLDNPDAAVGEHYFTVNMRYTGQTTTMNQTPKDVTTVVNSDASNTNAALWGNFGPVIIDGNSSTAVNIGYPFSSTGTITSGIEANVTVEGGASMIVNNSGNTKTFENVKVTEQSISGSGLFGSNNVTLQYGGIRAVSILTGQLADGYTIAPSSANAVFFGTLTISSTSSWAFHVNVAVNAASDLNLTLFNQRPQLGVLDVTAIGGVVDFPGTNPSGTIGVLFGGKATSHISYFGFNDVF